MYKGIFVLLFTVLFSLGLMAEVSYDIVVDKSGKGDFTTVQDAINSVPDYRKSRTVILIKEGDYNEKIKIGPEKNNLSLIGEGNVKLTYDDRASRHTRFGEEMGTSATASVFIYPDNFYAENIIFENPAGLNAGQAVACFLGGDKMFFKNCRFLGFQDTLYAYSRGRQYFEECYLEGSVDFIFGSSTALFNRCEIHSNRAKGYLTAPSTPQDHKHGFVFYNCKLTADEGCDEVWLGRPWRPYGKTAFIKCDMGSHIRAEGWHNWRKPEREKTCTFVEYANHGAGSDTSARAFGYVLQSLEGYSFADILGDWIPEGADFQE